MKKFILRIAILGIFSGFIYFALIVIIENIFKEPILTSSISFDKKMQFLKNQNLNQVDVLAIGSSMTLNNFNSEIIASKFKIDGKYLNLGAWGLQMSDILIMTKYFVGKYSPKLVIISSSLTDFEIDGSYFKIPEAEKLDYYFSNNYFKLFAGHVDLNSYLDRYLELKNTANGNYDYKCLNFDKYGGVYLDISQDKIDSSRWSRKIFMPKEVQYNSLKNLVDYLNENNIKLIFIQCPIKTNIERIDVDKGIINSHINKINKIFNGKDQLFLNLLDDQLYSELDFCDTYHLNKIASDKFTNRVIEFSNISLFLK
jgi:hypothetical protein